MVPGILPDLPASEVLDATRIHGAAGEPPWPRHLDRIDLAVSVLPVAVEAWSGETRGERSAVVRRRTGLPHAVEVLWYRMRGFG